MLARFCPCCFKEGNLSFLHSGNYVSASIKLFSLHAEGTRWRKIHFLKEEYTSICTWVDTTDMNRLVRSTPSFCKAWQAGFRSIKVSAVINIWGTSLSRTVFLQPLSSMVFSLFPTKNFPRTTESTAENSQTGLNMFCLKFSFLQSTRIKATVALWSWVLKTPGALFTRMSWMYNWGELEPGGMPSMGSHRVGHDWSDLAATAAATRLSMHAWENERPKTVCDYPRTCTEQTKDPL